MAPSIENIRTAHTVQPPSAQQAPRFIISRYWNGLATGLHEVQYEVAFGEQRKYNAKEFMLDQTMDHYFNEVLEDLINNGLTFEKKRAIDFGCGRSSSFSKIFMQYFWLTDFLDCDETVTEEIFESIEANWEYNSKTGEIMTKKAQSWQQGID